MISPEEALGIYSIAPPRPMRELYSFVFKTDQRGPPVGTPCFMEKNRFLSYEKELKAGVNDDSYKATVLCFFPFAGFNHPFTKIAVRMRDIVLIERGSFFERLIMVEKDFFDLKEILTSGLSEDLKKAGGILIDMPAEACPRCMHSLYETTSHFKHHSVLSCFTNLNYVDDKKDLRLIVLITDMAYAIPVFGRKRKDGIAIMMSAVDVKNSLDREQPKTLGHLSLVMTNEKERPFVIDGVDIMPINRLGDTELSKMVTACTACIKAALSSPKAEPRKDKTLFEKISGRKPEGRKVAPDPEDYNYIKIDMNPMQHVIKEWIYEPE